MYAQHTKGKAGGLICILCPKGCYLEVKEAADGFAVTGAGCEKGTAYAQEEMTHPVRMVTSTVAIDGAKYPRLPVKSEHPIPKEKVLEAARALRGVRVSSPVHLGDVVARDVAGTGTAFVATRDL